MCARTPAIVHPAGIDRLKSLSLNRAMSERNRSRSASVSASWLRSSAIGRRLGDPRPAREQITDAPHERIGVERLGHHVADAEARESLFGAIWDRGQEQHRNIDERRAPSEQIEYVDPVETGRSEERRVGKERRGGCGAERR